ncbi:MAG: glycosyltransferase family 4 protein [Gammaproteobacteria bacterium]
MNTVLMALVVIFASSAALTWLVWRFAAKLSLLDQPNARSMHVTPTARGGGVAIVVSFAAGLLFLAARGEAPWPVVLTLLGAALPVALIGMWDDVRELPPMFRLIVHFVAAVALVGGLGGVPDALGSELAPPLTAALHGLMVVAVVWLLNLYNFMDGTDGFASAQTIFVAVGAALIGGLGGNFAPLSLVLGASVLGFLLFNWPPARIFMGDVASGFIGLILAGLGLYSIHSGTLGVCVWLLLLATFIVDATVTLMHRARRGQRVYVGHREHAYQHFAIRHGHLRTVLLYQAMNLLVLLPLAWWVHQMPAVAVPVTVLTYLVLALLLLWLGAGCEVEAQ